jgi:molybdopterin-guanine dinucleotide biosynthesis protein B
MIEIAVVGAKNSGKTTVIEGLVKHLVHKRYRVATIKHTSHSHRFDAPGKDSYRHRQAGASMTIAMGSDEVGIFSTPAHLDIDQFKHHVNELIDIWIIEGNKKSEYPKILVTRGLHNITDELPADIVATIGPNRLDEVSTHFEAEDYDGLGTYIISTMLGQKLEIC